MWVTLLDQMENLFKMLKFTHLSIFYHLPGPGYRGEQSKQKSPGLPLHGRLHLLRGDIEAFPSQQRHKIPHSGPGFSRTHPNQMPEPPKLAHVDVEESQLYSESLQPNSEGDLHCA